jgi:hypothetical protein
MLTPNADETADATTATPMVSKQEAEQQDYQAMNDNRTTTTTATTTSPPPDTAVMMLADYARGVLIENNNGQQELFGADGVGAEHSHQGQYPVIVVEQQQNDVDTRVPAFMVDVDLPQQQVAAAASVEQENDDDKKNQHEPLLAMGDHVYQWCSLAGIPAVFQHHAIVLEAFYHHYSSLDTENSNNDAGGGEWRVRVADFSNAGPVQEELDGKAFNSKNKKHIISSGAGGSSGSSKKGDAIIRVYETSMSSWHKVQYGNATGWWQRHLFSRSGTCTSATSDPPGLVRSRVQFLLDHPQHLPRYNVIHSNCECVAVWCTTGYFTTVQASSWLSVTAAGQVKSAMTLVGAASTATTTVTVPQAGLWGWMGYTTTAQVPLLTSHPFLLPAIAAYGVVTVGAPAVVLWSARQHWKRCTQVLNDAYWAAAVENPEIFVDCITHWSALS